MKNKILYKTNFPLFVNEQIDSTITETEKFINFCKDLYSPYSYINLIKDNDSLYILALYVYWLSTTDENDSLLSYIYFSNINFSKFLCLISEICNKDLFFNIELKKKIHHILKNTVLEFTTGVANGITFNWKCQITCYNGTYLLRKKL